MSQRRGGAKPLGLSPDEDVPLKSRQVTNLELEPGISNTTTSNGDGSDGLAVEKSAPVSVEERYENEHCKLKVANWKESPFAVGLTEITWEAEQEKFKRKSSPMDDDHSVDSANCLCFSAAVCPLVGAERVGAFTCCIFIVFVSREGALRHFFSADELQTYTLFQHPDKLHSLLLIDPLL